MDGGEFLADLHRGRPRRPRASRLGLATLLVVAAAGFSASNSMVGGLAGPTITVIGQYRAFEQRGTARPTQAQLEQARRNMALVMIGSFVALIVGAGAAVGGSRGFRRARRVRRVHGTTTELDHGFRTWSIVVATWGTFAGHHSARAVLALTELAMASPAAALVSRP